MQNDWSCLQSEKYEKIEQYQLMEKILLKKKANEWGGVVPPKKPRTHLSHMFSKNKIKIKMLEF